MSSGVLNYRFPAFTGLTSHGSPKPLLLGDWNLHLNPSSRHTVDVQVRSGDYFVTLATVLDALAGDIDAYPIRAELENIVSDLIYLQDAYTITKDEPSRIDE